MPTKYWTNSKLMQLTKNELAELVIKFQNKPPPPPKIVEVEVEKKIPVPVSDEKSYVWTSVSEAKIREVISRFQASLVTILKPAKTGRARKQPMSVEQAVQEILKTNQIEK